MACSLTSGSLATLLDCVLTLDSITGSFDISQYLSEPPSPENQLK